MADTPVERAGAIDASSDTLLAGISAGGVGVWRWDTRTGRVSWSPNMEAIHRRLPGSFDGTFGDFLADIHPGDRDRVQATIDAALAGGAEYRSEYRLATAHGAEERWIEERGTPIMEAGSAIGMTGTCLDITDRKRVERELERRVRQQDGIARFGELAIRQTAVQALFDVATVEARRLLNCEFCKILQLLPDGENFILRAGVGWREGLVGSAIVPANLESQSGYTMKVEHSVIVDDMLTETRFSLPQLLSDHGVRSGISVLIAGEEGKIFGVLGAHSSKPGHFRDTDLDFMQSLANFLAGAVHRNLAMERQLLLTRELRHRVGNLLTLVLSLFNNTARRAGSVDELFEKFVARVMSLSRTHTHLSYGGWSTAGMLKVVNEVLEPFIDRITVDGRDLQITADAAFALSLALHELATNAAKFGSLAVPDGRLTLSWRRQGHEAGQPCLVVEWTETGGAGVVVPDSSGFGTRLVTTIVTEQLGGDLIVDYRPQGLHLTMRLPLARLVREVA